MQGLYPIIRRKRRPLTLADEPPVGVGNVEPVQPVAVVPPSMPEVAEPVALAPAGGKERRAKRKE